MLKQKTLWKQRKEWNKQATRGVFFYHPPFTGIRIKSVQQDFPPSKTPDFYFVPSPSPYLHDLTSLHHNYLLLAPLFTRLPSSLCPLSLAALSSLSICGSLRRDTAPLSSSPSLHLSLSFTLRLWNYRDRQQQGPWQLCLISILPSFWLFLVVLFLLSYHCQCLDLTMLHLSCIFFE